MKKLFLIGLTFFTLTARAEEIKKIGVIECDDYVAKVMDCVKSKVPASIQETTKTQMAQSIKSWEALVANEQTKAALATACKQALETAKESFKPYGCAL